MAARLGHAVAEVAIVILAAGASRRLGRPKQTLMLDGRPLLQHVVDAARAAAIGRVVVVLGANASSIRSVIALPQDGTTVVNREYATGQASSLRAGLSALGDDVARVVILLGDQPHISSEVIRSVAMGPGPIRRASYRDGPGHPVAFERSLWSQLVEIDGDHGARELITDHPDLVVSVEVPSDGPRDVDTDDDARAIGAT